MKFKSICMVPVEALIEATDITAASKLCRAEIEHEKGKYVVPPILLRVDPIEELEPQTS